MSSDLVGRRPRWCIKASATQFLLGPQLTYEMLEGVSLLRWDGPPVRCRGEAGDETADLRFGQVEMLRDLADGQTLTGEGGYGLGFDDLVGELGRGD